MTEQNPLARIFARPPRALVRYPQIPVDLALAQCAALEAEIQGLVAAALKASLTPEDDGSAELIGNVAVHVWRARNRMTDPATGEVREDMRKVHRHVESALESLGNAGVRVEDWQGKPFDVGLPLKVLSYQPELGLTQDTVIETIRPAILWKGRMLQMGEVIVGTPDGKTS